MDSIVNLGRHRKALAKAARQQQAAENRASHGRTLAERARDVQAEARRRSLLDGARRDDAEQEGEEDRS